MKEWFDVVPSRRGTASVKWDERPDALPLWIADMDFPAAPCIREALQRKLDQGVFGYTKVPESYFEATIRWFGRRHSWRIGRESIIPIEGIVPATSVAIKALTAPGDGVIMQTPAYNCFFSSIRNTGCVLLENKLLYDGADGSYRLDFEDFERCCADPRAKVFLLCNPHNPSGRLWSREELLRLWEICQAHDIPVISDEIHCDIVPPGSSYTPFASLSEEAAERSISFVSPSKSFNIAGLCIANIISACPEYRRRLDRVINDWEHCDVGQFGPAALEAAWSPEGEAWLDEMNAYVHDNYLYLRERFARECPACTVTPLEATYLVWVRIDRLVCEPDAANASDKGDPSGHSEGRTLADKTPGASAGSPLTGKAVEEFLLKEEKVWVNGGQLYGDNRFIRINIACPRSTLTEALDRILRGLMHIGRFTYFGR